MLRTLPGSRRLDRKLVTGSSGVNQDVASATLPLWVCSCQATGGATGERNVVHRHHRHAGEASQGVGVQLDTAAMAAYKLLAGALRSRTGCPWLLLWPCCVTQLARATAKSAWHNDVLASVSLLVDFKLDLQIPTHTNVVERCLVACAAYSCRFVPGRRCVRVMPPTGNGP